ncbi:MAG: 7TM diverse intracellular signaling domain-containing protein [Ferruginibacter sp.]
MKHIITLLLFLLSGYICAGQAPAVTDTIFISDVKNESNLLDKTWFYFDTSNSLPLPEVLKKPFGKFKTAYPKVRIKPEKVNATLYLKLLITNNTDKETSAYLDPRTYFKKYDLYIAEGESTNIQDSSNVSNYKKITLAAGTTGLFLLEVKPLKTEIGTISPVLINAGFLQEYKLFLTRQKSDIQIFGLILSGVLFMMILFMLTNFIISRKQEFLYNAAYSLCMFLLIFFNSSLARGASEFINFYFAYFDFFLLVTGNVFYISFARKFLDTKNNYVLLDQLLKYAVRFISLLLIIFTLLHFFTDTFLPQYYLEISVKILFLLLGFAFIYLALKRKDRLFNYIAAGNAMLVIFSLASLIILFLKIKSTHIFFTSLFYYNTGIVLELTFFLLGLTYKNRNELIREIKKQESLKMDAGKKEFETRIAVIQAQQEERNRISADMHDDLGAGMTTISLYSELAKSKLVNNPIPEIDKISSAANELLNKMNAIIWSMNNSNDSLGNMIAYIRSYTLEYFEDTGIHCKIDIPENLPNIQVIGTIRRNVFLVVKEALNNILKHAKATEVNITLIRVEDGLTLYIRDNGTGIDLEKLRQFGNGLKNMKKRMTDIGVDFSIENLSDGEAGKNGTLITLHRKVTTF